MDGYGHSTIIIIGDSWSWIIQIPIIYRVADHPHPSPNMAHMTNI